MMPLSLKAKSCISCTDEWIFASKIMEIVTAESQNSVYGLQRGVDAGGLTYNAGLIDQTEILLAPGYKNIPID